MSRFDGSNESGMFRVTFQHRHYYFLTPQEKKQVIYPSPLDRVWKERVLQFASAKCAFNSIYKSKTCRCVNLCDRGHDSGKYQR